MLSDPQRRQIEAAHARDSVEALMDLVRSANLTAARLGGGEGEEPPAMRQAMEAAGEMARILGEIVEADGRDLRDAQ